MIAGGALLFRIARLSRPARYRCVMVAVERDRVATSPHPIAHARPSRRGRGRLQPPPSPPSQAVPTGLSKRSTETSLDVEGESARGLLEQVAVPQALGVAGGQQ